MERSRSAILSAAADTSSLGGDDSNDPITVFAANASDLWCAVRNDEVFVGIANAMLLVIRVVGCFMVE